MESLEYRYHEASKTLATLKESLEIIQRIKID